MATFKVEGGFKLKGDLHPQGAKNEALQVLCAVLLTQEEVIMENVPSIRDVNILIDLLRDLNVSVNQINESAYSFYNISACNDWSIAVSLGNVESEKWISEDCN